MRRGLAEDRARRAARARRGSTRKNTTAPSAAPRPSHTGGSRPGHAGGEHDQHRLEDEAELRDAEVELGLEGREAEQEAAGERHDCAHFSAQLRSPLRLPGGGVGAPALDEQDGHARPASSRRRRSASGAWGPTASRPGRRGGARRRRAGSRPARTRRRRRPARRRAGAYQSPPIRTAVALGPLLGHHHREEAGGEDAEQAGQDEVVRGVRQRPLVAADVDVKRDVPVHPEHGGDQRARSPMPGGQRGPARQAADALGEGGPAARAGRSGRSGAPCRATSSAAVSDRRRRGGDHDLADGGAAGGLAWARRVDAIRLEGRRSVRSQLCVSRIDRYLN